VKLRRNLNGRVKRFNYFGLILGSLGRENDPSTKRFAHLHANSLGAFSCIAAGKERELAFD
jgi:hypothetical protein